MSHETLQRQLELIYPEIKSIPAHNINNAEATYRLQAPNVHTGIDLLKKIIDAALANNYYPADFYMCQSNPITLDITFGKFTP